MNEKLKIGIIGIGMVGEPLRRWFEEILGYKRGKELFCYDTDPKKGYSDDFNKADIVFVAVPTPSNPDGSCNISIVESATDSIKDGKIIVIKSTIPPGTAETIQKKHRKKRIIFNPEFLTEAQAWIDFISPDRQIVAHTTESISDALEVLSVLPKRHFIRPWASDYTKRSVNASEAELSKYASNIFGYIKVTFGNILADICHALNLKFKQEEIPTKADYENVREIISADLRIGPSWLNIEHGNYCGVGGYCFPKDMNAFISFAKDLIEFLKKLPKKSGADAGQVKTLEKGIGILRAVRAYNEELLKWQGLSTEDVAKHEKEIIIRKRKQIRIHPQNRQKR
jgi:UDPglucose 6-dehydrogenase